MHSEQRGHEHTKVLSEHLQGLRNERGRIPSAPPNLEVRADARHPETGRQQGRSANTRTFRRTDPDRGGEAHLTGQEPGDDPTAPPAPRPAGASRHVPVRDTLLDSDDLAPLGADDAVRIAAAMDAAYAETTRTVYAFASDRWVRWCADRGVGSFPADPAAVCAYLSRCAEQGLTLASVDSACSDTSAAPTGRPTRSSTTRSARSAAGSGACLAAHLGVLPGPSASPTSAGYHRHRPQHGPRHPRHRHPADPVRRCAASLRARHPHPGRPRAQTRRTPDPPAPLQDRPGRVRSRRRHRARLPPAHRADHGSGPLAGPTWSSPRPGFHQPPRPDTLPHPDLRERRLQRRQGTRHQGRPRW
jgi:hypothetical protein